MAVLLEDAVALVHDEIVEQGRRMVAFQAPPGFGKSAVLAGLAASLVAMGRPVLHISFPTGDDAALAALVETAAGLEGRAPGLLDQVVPRDEARRGPWSARLAPVGEALARAPEELVVLVDEPRFDLRVKPDEEIFVGRSAEITELLLHGHRGAVVLAGEEIPPTTVRAMNLGLPLTRDGDLARMEDGARRLGGRRPLSDAPPPPVVTQILKALVAAGVDVGRIPRGGLRAEHLVTHDLGTLCRDSATLRRMMARLAAIRVPFGADWLDLAGLAALPEVEQRLVRHLLSPGPDATFTLPPAIADVIRAQIGAGDPAWLPDEPAGDAHREAAGYHGARHARCRERGDLAGAMKEELEEIHQLTEAGDAGALLGRSLQFVEQYDALGRSLSRRALREDRPEAERLRLDAVRAYERALAHDPDDAYAHHYLAYNLDILGMSPERVNEEFLAARDLDPAHPWYHGRYVCFLITRSRMEQARAAWERALVDLGYATGPRRRVYEELHGPVARHLLSHAQLAFASEVLDDVPREQRDAPWWRALSRFCVHLEEDRDERLVFPLGVALEERWNGPHLLAEDPEGPRVVRWRPGRVVATEEGAVILHVSEQPPPAPERIRTLRLTAQALRERWRWSARIPAPGTFVELIEYEDGGAELKSWDRDASGFVPGLPRLFPHPDRYIRRAFA